MTFVAVTLALAPHPRARRLDLYLHGADDTRFRASQVARRLAVQVLSGAHDQRPHTERPRSPERAVTAFRHLEIKTATIAMHSRFLDGLDLPVRQTIDGTSHF